MKVRSLFVLLFAIIFAACSSKVGTSTSKTNTSSAGKYNEDLSVWRPKGTNTDTTRRQPTTPTTDTTPGSIKSKEYVEAKFAVNEPLDAVLDSISRINKSIGYVDGYTIQVYSGLKREEALKAKKQLSNSLPDVDSEVQYVQPNFRVRVGKYYDRFNAQKDYAAVKRYFPNAILIPERIPIQ
jgi:hypothetical protein